MIPDDLIITRRLSKRPICREIIEALVQSDTLLAIDTAPLKTLFQCPYFDYSTYNGPIYYSPTYEGQAKCLANDKTHQGF